MLVVACTPRKTDHVEMRDPHGANNKCRKHIELDNDARLEKRTSLAFCTYMRLIIDSLFDFFAVVYEQPLESVGVDGIYDRGIRLSDLNVEDCWLNSSMS
jgi:hypothetical protein